MIFVKNKKAEFSNLSDNELAVQIVEAEDRLLRRQMQEALYERYADKIFARCFNLVHNREVAKDLAHDILVKIFLNLSNFKGISPLYAWINAIAYNHCISYLEKEKKLQFEKLTNLNERIASDDIELEHKILQELQLVQLERLMEQLQEKERLVLIMRYLDGMSIKQIATILNLGESAVKMRLKRSRDQLATLLNAIADE